MSRYITCQHEQGTPEWFQDRLGMVTGSTVKAVFAKAKVPGAGTRVDLMTNLVLENITGHPTSPSFAETESIAWGKAQEPNARIAYEIFKGVDVEEAGFLYLPDMKAGCSLDGKLVDRGQNGILEIKCLKTKNHYACLLEGVAPKEYLPQIIHNLWITGAKFCDFMSFDPRMPEELQQFHIRVERNDSEIDAHEFGVRQFLIELNAQEAKMRTLIATRRAALDQEELTHV
jgi:hypothetical protein